MSSITEIIENSIKNGYKQIILTGAPGTGKTWSVREYVKQECYEFVQFHPSYDYTDFVEGLRPVVIQGGSECTFVRLDGEFKSFCRRIVEEDQKEKRYFFVIDEINRANLAKVFGELMFGLEASYRGEQNKFKTPYRNLVTYRILDKKDCGNNKYSESDIGKAVPMESDVFKEGFYIPENLYIIGTMNDIDRSVDSIDFALRRRFTWIDIKANEIMQSSLESILPSNVFKPQLIEELAGKIKAMNKVISENNKFGLSEAYHIGPAYFKGLKTDSEQAYQESLEHIFDHNIFLS